MLTVSHKHVSRTAVEPKVSSSSRVVSRSLRREGHCDTMSVVQSIIN